MSSKPQFSPLMDNLLLSMEPQKPSFISNLFAKFPTFDWYNIVVNIVIPVTFILIVAFILKDKYDKKREKDEELMLLSTN